MSVTIAELEFMPGKGMAGYDDVEELIVGADGLFGDREYMWVEAEPHVNVLYHRGDVAQPGRFLSMREDPVLSQVVPALRGSDGVSLDTRSGGNFLFVPRTPDTDENRKPVSVWGWNGQAVDQGDEAARWGADIIGRPVRLVAVSGEEPRWVENNRALGRVGFSDGYPVTVGSTESIALINEKLSAAEYPAISARRPRMTLALSGLVLPNRDSLPEYAFPEDYVAAIRISSDGIVAVLERIKACGRCPVPDTNEITGERKGAPVRKALGQLARNGFHTDTDRYGSSPELFWTQNFVIRLPKDMDPDATIRIARDREVEVVYADDTNWSNKRK